MRLRGENRSGRSAGFLLLGLALAALGGIPARASDPSGAARNPDVALTHATLIDGTGSPPRADVTVLIRKGRIVSVFAAGSRPLPAGTQIEDLRGRTLIPGLIDAHVHLTGDLDDPAKGALLLRALLTGGVTAVRDMAGDDRVLAEFARRSAEGKIVSPDIFYSALVAGPTFFAEDRRAQAASEGHVLGHAPWMKAITAGTDLRIAVAEAAGTGATGIKIYANLPAALVKAIAEEAHRQGLMVWTHAAIFPAGPRDAVAAGADTVSHSPYLVWEAAPRIPQDYGVRAHGDFTHIRPDGPRIISLLEEMKERGTILDATLRVFAWEAEHHPEAVGEGIVPWSYAVTRLAHERGVLIDAGTDSGGLPTAKDGPDLTAPPAVDEEMELLVAHAGFTPVEAIRAATEVSAMAIGQLAERGTIRAGKRADFVVLSADPAADIHNVRKVVEVYKDGRLYHPERKASGRAAGMSPSSAASP
jgi:imidazolonepropionase-like amidohydrolase